MDLIKTIEILEALAAGCSPTTGEIVDQKSVLNERDVIRALQVAIDQLKTDVRPVDPDVEIDLKDIDSVFELFDEVEERPTVRKLVGFFLGNRKFKKERVVSDPQYGKYQGLLQQGQLFDFFTKYKAEHPFHFRGNQKNNRYREIDFFQKEPFNHLSEPSIKQLKEKVELLGVQKTENLSEIVQNARINHPRAFESWTEHEKALLKRAIDYTNDLDLLSACFQRGKGAIESCGQRLIYEAQQKPDEASETGESEQKTYQYSSD